MSDPLRDAKAVYVDEVVRLRAEVERLQQIANSECMLCLHMDDVAIERDGLKLLVRELRQRAEQAEAERDRLQAALENCGTTLLHNNQQEVLK
jgi:hypothetical protein